MVLGLYFFQPSDDDTISLHSQVSESNREQTSRNDSHSVGSKPDSQKGNPYGVCYIYFMYIALIKIGLRKILSLANSFIEKTHFYSKQCQNKLFILLNKYYFILRPGSV